MFFIDEPYWPLNTTLYVEDFKGNDALFAYYLLQTLDFARFSDKTSVPGVNRNDLHRIRIKRPPLPEQRRIAAILSTWDEAIALTERLIAALQQRKQGLMQRLLTGQVRFPGFVRSTEMQETKYGQIPVDWGLVRIGKVATVNSESLPESADPDAEYYYIDLSAVNHGTIDFSDEKQSFGDLPSRARRVLHFRDVIMATVRPNLLGYALCDFDRNDVLCSTGFALISPRDERDADLIYHNLYGDVVQRQVHGLVTGSNYPAVNGSEVKGLQISWPRIPEERHRIGEVLRLCDEESENLTQYAGRLKEQKKGLMQRLLTGQIRVRVD